MEKKGKNPEKRRRRRRGGREREEEEEEKTKEANKTSFDENDLVLSPRIKTYLREVGGGVGGEKDLGR